MAKQVVTQIEKSICLKSHRAETQEQRWNPSQPLKNRWEEGIELAEQQELWKKSTR